jgi:RNA polymerase sigma-70 factor (ECF subfamily)
VTAVTRRSTPSDDELAAAAGSGDETAFAELYARYVDRVYMRVVHLVGPGPDSDDVLQQVFIGLHRALPRFRGESQISTFLYRITVNVAYDHLRRRARRSGEHDVAALDALIDDAPTPEDRVRRRDELRQIFALLEQIKPKKRIAFVLVAVEGLSLAEAAELVGARVDAVKQRVLHARRELVALMADAELHPRRRP